MSKSDLINYLKTAGKRLFIFSIFCLAVPLLLIWCFFVLRFTLSESLSGPASIVYLVFSIGILLIWKDIVWSMRIFAAVSALVFIGYFAISPSHDRNWLKDVEKIPQVSFNENKISIKNFRHFRYTSNSDFEQIYEERVYDLEQLEGADFIISYWDGHRSIGHTFVSFRFKNQPPLCISVEVRKEQGEKYHPVNGLFKQYELIYVIGDERDMISLRTNHRSEETFLYPLSISKEQSQTFLVSLLKGAQSLEKSPRFYHSLDQNCTTTLVHHINDVPEFKVEVNMDLILNGLSDYAVYKMEGLRTDLPFIALKNSCYISEICRKIPLDENFSQKLRNEVNKKIESEVKAKVD